MPKLPTHPRRLAILFAIVATVSLSPAAAVADPASVANALNEAFHKSFVACDVPAMLALYEKDAVVVWPRQGEMAVGKAAMEKVFRASCSGPSKQSITPIASHARSAGKDYILHFGEIEATVTGPGGKPVTMRIRDTELLHKSGGKWRFVIDHASVGIPPPASAGGKTP